MRHEKYPSPILLIPALLILVSCVDPVENVNLPNVEPRLVVFSYLSPGEPVRVRVWASEPLAYNRPIRIDPDQYHHYRRPQLRHAQVVISCIETGAERAIAYCPDDDTYILPPADFPIVPGRTYRLSAASEGLRPVSASATVPWIAPRVSELRLDTLNRNPWEITYRLTGLIHDIPGQENHYIVTMEYAHHSCWDEHDWETDLLDTVCYAQISRGSLTVTDFGNDGESIGFELEFYLFHHSSLRIEGDTLPPDWLSAQIMVADEHLRQFNQSLDTYWDNFQNPFGEAAPLYTNIRGGLGLFSAHLDTTILLVGTP